MLDFFQNFLNFFVPKKAIKIHYYFGYFIKYYCWYINLFNSVIFAFIIIINSIINIIKIVVTNSHFHFPLTLHFLQYRYFTIINAN